MNFNPRLMRISSPFLAIILLFPGTIGLARSPETPSLSGSYQILQKTELGSQTRVRIQFHLINHGGQALHVQRLILWNSTHPTKGGTQAAHFIIPALGSINTTQQFTIPHSEYSLWERGSRPRLILGLEMPVGLSASQAVRLDRFSAQKAD
jgi:hypothetical protein